jgi:hypothetical protein
VRAEAGRAGVFVTGALADDGARFGDGAAVLAALAARPEEGVAGFAGDAPRALALAGAVGAFAFFAAGFVPLATDFDFSATALMGDRRKPANKLVQNAQLPKQNRENYPRVHHNDRASPTLHNHNMKPANACSKKIPKEKLLRYCKPQNNDEKRRSYSIFETSSAKTAMV